MAELKIQFLDVGQGDGIFIQFPGGGTMLVDLGSTKNKGLVSTDILQYFKGHTKFANPGVTLDYLILTHADRDHYNMVLEFIKGLDVKVARLMHGGSPDEYKIPKQTDGSKAKNLIEKIVELCPGVVQVKATGYFPFPLKHDDFGGAEVHVLAANTPATSHSDEGWRKNTASIVLMLVYGKAP
jgi:glyoxylase-like metal-dependent hydrolase (beta-lactamase superfamily II)